MSEKQLTLEKRTKPNYLNDLDEKAWAKFTISYRIYRLPPRSKVALAHPATFPPHLAEDFISFFTKKGEWVLDPFAGVGTTNLAAKKLGRNSVGVELTEKWATMARERLKEVQDDLFNPTTHLIFTADARDIFNLPLPTRQFDYILTSPPYWSALHVEGDKLQKMRKERGLDTIYSEDERDLGNICDYEEFMRELVKILYDVSLLLRPGRYMTIIIRNVRITGVEQGPYKEVFPLAWDLALRLASFPHLRLCDEIIWIQDHKPVFLFAYGYRLITNKCHHYCINFVRE